VSQHDSEPAGESVEDFQDAANQPDPGFWREFGYFLRHSPSWWLAPLIITLMLLGLAVTMIPVEAMPFIYTLW
jgi:hypothetical protein